MTEEEKKANELIYNDIVLNLINKLQKENEELKTDNYELNNRITDLSKNIPVQKIKDKIEELDKKVKDYQCVENRINLYQRKVLQELLEEEK
jgi:cell division protein FtsB